MRELCIAGRGSRLAMAQNELVKKLLEKEGYKVRILTVSTQGDRDRKSSVTALGGNGPFVRDVEKALLSGEADIAVHCVKDLPYEMAPGLCIAGMPDAADPRDCLILREAGREPAEAEKKLIIGTGSPRRMSQLRALWDKQGSEIEFRDIRGNITTRLEKLRRGEYDGIVLAKAGLDRIGADTPPENYLRYEIERGIFCRFRCDCRSAVGIHARVRSSGAQLLVLVNSGGKPLLS